MNETTLSPVLRYFPAILCEEHDSPIDALVSLCVPRDEATDLVVASWSQPGTGGADGVLGGCLLAVLDGGRTVAVLATEPGRWAACNAFLGDTVDSPGEAERRLARLLKRGRRGFVATLPLARMLAQLPVGNISSIRPIQ